MIHSFSFIKEEIVEAAEYCHRWRIFLFPSSYRIPTSGEHENIAKQDTKKKSLYNMMSNTYTEVNCLHLTAFGIEREQTHL